MTKEETSIQKTEDTVEQPQQISLQELAKFIYDHFYDDYSNTIDISGLDFSSYKCDIDISHMIVCGTICQNLQEADEDIIQNEQYAGRDLYQNNQTAERNLYTKCNYAGRKIYE